VEKTDVVVLENAPGISVDLRGPVPNATTGTPTESAHRAWTSPSEQIRSGVWECTPGSFPGNHAETEVCYLLSGRVTLTAEGKEPVDAGPGAMIVFPAGWQGTWEIHETIRKVFVIGNLT
jgi:uncharacterized protein